jgi:hypothetical protein
MVAAHDLIVVVVAHVVVVGFVLFALCLLALLSTYLS